MARNTTKTIRVSTDTPRNPSHPEQETKEDTVTDLPPANPFNEPVDDVEEYPEGNEESTIVNPVFTPETTVEHPLSPTDSNPNPHGTRTPEAVRVPIKDEDGNVTIHGPQEGDVEVEGTKDGEPVHLGDGRTLGKGQRMKVHKDVLKDENLKGHFKRV